MTVAASLPLRCVLVTLDSHLAGAAERARRMVGATGSGVELAVHVAADWAAEPERLARCLADIAAADVIVVTQLFMDDHVKAVLPALQARRDACRAIACAICAPELMRLTRLGRFRMEASGDAGPWSPATIMRRLLGGGPTPVDAAASERTRAGERQLKALRRVPQLLRFVPGPAQDVRAYYLVLQYWLAGSAENVAAMIRFLAARYAGRGDERRVPAPREYPEVGVYHPRLAGRMTDDAGRLPHERGRPRVGLLLMRAYVLAENTRHYDAVIEALEARGLAVVPAFAAGLDSRPAMERFFLDAEGRATVDAVVSLTGFSLVGGPAYNDAEAARELLARIDVPYLSLQTLEFQSVEQWQADPRGLNPLQAALQVAIPELDGATGPLVYAGTSRGGVPDDAGDVAPSVPVAERVERLADRVAKLVRLRRSERRERRIAAVLFNFPPNAGNVGTAAYLGVFASLHRTLGALKAAGYTMDLPADADALRVAILEGNAERHGTPANVLAKIAADDHVRREPHLAEIERAWGPAPGRHLTDGRSLYVLGARFGNVAVVVQPGMGYEGDPMRLLFEGGFAPTHAFSAFYRWLREDFDAHAALHFGTHGALEFMPGKQSGLTGGCWPDRLVGDLPNVYLYAANNPSEGTLAKRRAAATLVSYLTPPIAHAGLYRGLADLRASLDRLRALPDDAGDDALHSVLDVVQAQAAGLDLAPAEPRWNGNGRTEAGRVGERLRELELTLIPQGLHVVGEPVSPEGRRDLLAALAQAGRPDLELPSLAELMIGDDDARREAAERAARLVADGDVGAALGVCRDAGADEASARPVLDALAATNALLSVDHELPALVRALDGRHVAPAPGGDVLRTPAILPTGRNSYGFDPYQVPTPVALERGRRQADRLLARHAADGNALPETVALVLWGSDNMKSEGEALSLALALLGAEPRRDAMGRLAGARLVPLGQLGRARVDVVMTVSGVFRDLFPLQLRLLAEAARLAADADEPVALNFPRAHRLAAVAGGVPDEDAALRVFANQEGAYGANVNLLVDNGQWERSSELADAFAGRRGFAYGVDGARGARPALLRSLLGGAGMVYQGLDAVETGLTELDQYVDSLGGLAALAREARGGDAPPVYVGDAAAGGRVRTLGEQVAIEARTRLLNPRWHEPLLRAGFEGARQVSAAVTQAVGWSATTASVPAWVYQDAAETFVLDPVMRDRLAALNPHAAARMGARLLEASDRGFWAPDKDTLGRLRDAAADLEDRLEGVYADA